MPATLVGLRALSKVDGHGIRILARREGQLTESFHAAPACSRTVDMAGNRGPQSQDHPARESRSLPEHEEFQRAPKPPRFAPHRMRHPGSANTNNQTNTCTPTPSVLQLLERNQPNQIRTPHRRHPWGEDMRGARRRVGLELAENVDMHFIACSCLEESCDLSN